MLLALLFAGTGLSLIAAGVTLSLRAGTLVTVRDAVAAAVAWCF
jgi:hypothetical protein